MEIGGEKVDRCPRRPLLNEPALHGEVFWLYQNFLRGILPEGVALSSNPNKLVEMFRVIEDAKIEAEQEKGSRERQRAEMRARAKEAFGLAGNE